MKKHFASFVFFLLIESQEPFIAILFPDQFGRAEADERDGGER